jgi:hypothetical protein
MTPRRWSDIAIVALIATALIAAGVVVVAVVSATSENSPVQLVLETATATPSGPTAVPWADLAAEPSPIPRRVALSSNKPTPTNIPTPTDVPAPPCRPDDLVLGMGEPDREASGETFNVVIANASSEPCRLVGRPVVSLLDPNGKPVQAPLTVCPNQCGAGGVLTPSHPVVAYGKLEIQDGSAVVSIYQPGPAAGPDRLLSDCNTRATAVLIRIPGFDGELSLPFSGSGLDGCIRATVNRFLVREAPPPPPPLPSTFAMHLVAPATAIAGTTLKYYVVLTNVSPAEVTFVDGHCPSYGQTLTLTSPPRPPTRRL